jgi:hypothetical protein
MAKVKQLKFIKDANYFKVTQEEFSSLMSDRLLKKIVQFIFFLLAFNLIIITLLWNRLPPQLPLFYQKPWGQEQLVSKTNFLILPASNLIFCLINIRIASFFFKKENLLSQILVFSSLTICSLASVTLIKIITIVL